MTGKNSCLEGNTDNWLHGWFPEQQFLSVSLFTTESLFYDGFHSLYFLRVDKVFPFLKEGDSFGWLWSSGEVFTKYRKIRVTVYSITLDSQKWHLWISSYIFATKESLYRRFFCVGRPHLGVLCHRWFMWHLELKSICDSKLIKTNVAEQFEIYSR